MTFLLLAAFVAGNVVGRGSGNSAGSGEPGPKSPLPAAPVAVSGAAPDISAMSFGERANRLFNRVMLFNERGKTDSARFFAPMAIQAYEMMGPVDAHVRYDIGVISMAAGDLVRARAEADTILTSRATHLLGLVLAIRASDQSRDAAASARFSARLVAAAPAERSAVKEYAEPARDIDDAVAKASSRPR